jgi:valyl-tRNA synthetase
MILCDREKEEAAKTGERYVKTLANLSEMIFVSEKSEVPEETMSAVVDGAEIFVPLDDLMDYEAELARLKKEKERLEGEVARVDGKLSNKGFVDKAPQKLVDEEKEKKVRYEDMLSKVNLRLEQVEKKIGG